MADTFIKQIAQIFGMDPVPEEDILSKLVDTQAGDPKVKADIDTDSFDIFPPGAMKDGIWDGNATYILFPKKVITDKFKGFNPSHINKFDINAFFNLISTIDMSLSVPYLSVRFIEKVPKGFPDDTDREAVNNNDLSPMQFTNMKLTPSFKLDPGNLFFAPQTWFSKENVKGNKDANLFRPPMAIKSFKVDIVNPFGLIAVQHAQMVIKVFDTARLNQISGLIMPGMTDSPIWEIEYGWSHPGAMSNSPSHATFAAKFINKLRDKTQYQVTNFNITMNADNTADVSLNMMSTPGTQLLNANLIGEGDYFSTLQEMTTQQGKYDKEQRQADVDKAKKGKISKPTKKRMKQVKKFNWRESDLLETNKIRKPLGKAVNEKLNHLFNSKDPGAVFKLDDFAKNTDWKASWQPLSKVETNQRYKKLSAKAKTKQFTSLGVLLYYLFDQLNKTQPTKGKKGEFDDKPKVETQIIFGNFNKYAGIKEGEGMSGKNIASFIIHRRKVGDGNASGFLGLLKIMMMSSRMANPQITDVIDLINEKFIRDPSNINYGFKAKLFKSDGKDAKGQTSYSVKGKLPKKFALPQLKMLIKEIPVGKDGKKVVRRVFIYDEADIEGVVDVSKSVHTAIPGFISSADDERDEADGKTKKMPYEEMLKEIRKKIPYIKLGTNRSMVKSLGFSTYSDPMQETVFMQKQGTFTKATDLARQQTDLPQTFFPTKGSMNIWGYPTILYGSLIFLDSRTRSTVDNIYRITGISHNFTPAGIDTSLDLTPDHVWAKIVIPYQKEE